MPWYLQQEALPGGCPVAGTEHDLYQFGVPTEMNSTVAELERLGMASYQHYYGFDSFIGLPDEAHGVQLPPGQWMAGQFSDVHQLSSDYREVFNRATWTRSYVPIARGRRSRPLTEGTPR